MQMTCVLELLKPTKNKSDIIEKNILEVQKNRTSIVAELKANNTNLSTKHFDKKLPSALINQNIREVKALYNNFKEFDLKKDNIEFKRNQPLCYNNQDYEIKDHFISIPLYTIEPKIYWFPLVKNETFLKLSNEINKGAKLGKASLFRKKHKYYFSVILELEINKFNGNNIKKY